jgi:signal transduction histidine kinase
VLEETGKIQQVSFNHVDRKKAPLVEQLFEEYVGNGHSTHGVGKILTSGKAEIISKITPEVIQSAKSSKISDIVKRLELKSYMGIPLKARDKIIGAVTFSSSVPGRYYTKKDLAFVQELGRRIAFALDNAQHFTNAQKAVRLRDDFLSVASHELKTPVTSLKAFTQVMKTRFERRGNKEDAVQLDKMDSQINKLTALIQDLLDTTKMQSGKLQLHMDTFSLDDLVSEIVEEIQRTTNHTLVIKKRTKKIMYGDRERIGQVLTNLITNAMKYSLESEPIIIKTEETKSDLICSVQDFGIGISEYQIPFLFERFYREIGSRENTFPGLGLGLYISSEIIKRHEGKIWVESEKGKGSRFYFSLPLKS